MLNASSSSINMDNGLVCPFMTAMTGDKGGVINDPPAGLLCMNKVAEYFGTNRVNFSLLHPVNIL